jgi:hypothetical protein
MSKPKRAKHTAAEVAAAFSPTALKHICEMHEDDFAEAFEMVYVPVLQKEPDDFYLFRDNGSSVLAVAHLDTVGDHWERTARFVETEDGPVIFSRALDDRLGAYVILDLLPALGITYDILLTVGEESGRSTASFFEPDKEYDWVIEFDRGGTDVVMYEYEDRETEELVKATGAKVGVGSFSDICYLEHLGVKAFNWGVGYQQYHGPRAHAFLWDTFSMVAKYLTFHDDNAGTVLPHEPRPSSWYTSRWYGSGWATEEESQWSSGGDEPLECDLVFGAHDHDDAECGRLLESMSIGVGRGYEVETVHLPEM